MPAPRYFSPADTLEQKLQIERRLGSVKARKYFSLLTRFLSFKIRKCEFDRLCIATIGRDNIPLHNHFLKSILKKASLSKTAPPPTRNTEEGCLNDKTTNGSNIIRFPRRLRTPCLRDRRFRDRPSPLGPHGKNSSIALEDSVPKIHEQQSNVYLPSLGNQPPPSVEDGEEVVQDSESLIVSRRSPVRAPLGIPTYNKRARKLVCEESESGTFSTDICQSIGQLPDTHSLTKILKIKLEKEELEMSADAANLLNNALDAYLKRLIKPCLDLAAVKSANKFSGSTQPGFNDLPTSWCVQSRTGYATASISDFRTSIELNPVILGENWPIHLEKVCLGASEERVKTGSTLY